MTRLQIAVLFFGFVSFYWHANAQGTRESSPIWDVYFSPRGGATFAIRQALDNARLRPADSGGQAKSFLRAEAIAQAGVLVQAYSFTSAPIAEALVKAHRRGVKVHVLLDKSQKTEKYLSAGAASHA